MSAGGRTRVAWVTAEEPHARLSGGSIRQAHLLRRLAAAAEVHLLLAGRLSDAEVRAACASVTELPAREPTPAPAWRRRLDNLRMCLPGAVPHEVRDSRAARRALSRALAERPADVVVVEHIGLAPLAPLRRPGRHRRWIITLHYLSSGTMTEWATLATTPAQRLVRRREADHARRLESSLWRRYDTVISVSPADAARLPGPAVIVPNGVAVADYPASPVPASADLLFVGRLNFLPNVDGVCWFADEVLPLIRAARPDARLTIVGRNPVPEVCRLAERPGITVHANAADVRPHLAACRLVVVPLRLGTGTRLKALEALAAGRPVVGTRTGLAGLDVSPAQAAVADGAVDMAMQALQLLGDDARATRLAVAGRELARSRYDWSVVAEPFIAAVLGAAPQPTSAQSTSAWARTEDDQS